MEALTRRANSARSQSFALGTAPQPLTRPAVPDAWVSEQYGGEFDDMTAGQGYRKGWNDCRAAMLAAAPQPEAQPASIQAGTVVVHVGSNGAGAAGGAPFLTAGGGGLPGGGSTATVTPGGCRYREGHAVTIHRDEILRMMAEAGAGRGDPFPPNYDGIVDTFARFAELVAGAEREACKAACRSLPKRGPDDCGGDNMGAWYDMSVDECIDAIAARGAA